MLGAIKYALINLANLKGRDARQTFWYWVLTVVLVRFAVSMMMTMPMTMRMVGQMTAAMQRGAADDEAAMQKMMFDMMAAELPRMVWLGIAVGAVSLLLLCASTVRRLHDSGLTGWLVLIPGILYAAGLAMAPMQIDAALDMIRNIEPGKVPDVAAMMRTSLLQAALEWIPVIMLIVIGVRQSTPGPNQYGEAPVRF